MDQNVGAEMLIKILERMPGVFWASRMNPATGASEWLYASPRMAELYGVSPDALRADPNALLSRIVPEDRAKLETLMAQTLQTLAPMNWIGRVEYASGEVRWLETQTNIEREEAGSLLWCGQVLDVTERKKTELALSEAEAARAKTDLLYRQVIDALPIGVLVANTALEFVVMNQAQRKLSGGIPEGNHGGEITAAYGVFKADGKTPLSMDQSGLVRGLRGEAMEEEVVIRNPRLPAEVRAHAVWTPLRDESGKVYASLGTIQDITTQRKLEQDLLARNEQLAASEAGKTELIERLRYAIDELSNPILEVWDDVLAMPIIGVVDSRRTSDMVQRLLAEVARTQASFVIMDLTGVEIVDTKTADHLIKLVRKVELVGARCVLTGIRPAVSETLVDIGVDFGRMTTLRNLKHGLREAIRGTRRRRDLERDLRGEDEELPSPQRGRPTA